MRALVIHESLTGNTRRAAQRIVTELRAEGWEAGECTSRQVDLAALQQSDVVIVGTWVDGLVLFGQRPGGAGKLAKPRRKPDAGCGIDARRNRTESPIAAPLRVASHSPRPAPARAERQAPR